MEILITEEEGSVSKFTEEMAVSAIRERDALRKELSTIGTEVTKGYQEVNRVASMVRQFFDERYSVGETEITCTVDDVNELLESIKAGKLKRLFLVRGTINFTVVDVEADDEDDASSIVETEMNLEFNGEGSLDDWSLDVDVSREQ